MALPKSDAELVAEFRRGEDLAFVALYQRYKHGVYLFCLKMLRDEESAKDVTQEVFLRAYEGLAGLTQAGSFKPWLFTIARNRCLSHLKRSTHTLPMDYARNEPSDEAVELAIEQEDQAQWVRQFIASLKPEYREVLLLREYQNLAYEDIAQVIGESVSAVKSRLFKARRKLQELMRAILCV